MRLIDADKFEEYLKDLHDKYTEDIEECKKEGHTSGASYLNTHKELLINIMLRLKQQPTVNEWIPCSERLPEDDTETLITTEHGGEITGIWNERRRYWATDLGFIPIRNVLAWMPLPETYKGDVERMRLIDGDAALEILRREQAKAKRIGEKQDDFMQGAMSALRAVCVMLEHQPTVNEWIPCSEKLPDMFEDVYTTAYVKAVGGTVDGEMLKIGVIGYVNELNQWTLKSTIRGFDFNSYENDVVAWMPLPERYKGDENK